MTTKLEVMNHMLSVVGEAPVTSASSNHPSALAASVELDKIAKEFQTRGWWFNREFAFPLTPEFSTGFVILPSNTLNVTPCNRTSALVQRGTKLYDPINHTFNIADTVYADIIVQLDIEDLPEAAAAYLKAKCALDFYVNDNGDQEKIKDLAFEVGRTWAEIQSAELKNAKINSSNRPITAYLRYRMHQQGARTNPTWPGGRR